MGSESDYCHYSKLVDAAEAFRPCCLVHVETEEEPSPGMARLLFLGHCRAPFGLRH
jgi:hypothetical protein